MTVERCPCCKQPLKRANIPQPPMRTCYDCGEHIVREHRYTFQERDGVKVPVTVHRSCEYPEGYYDLATCKSRRIAPYSCYSKKECEQIEQDVRDRCKRRGWECSLDKEPVDGS